MYHIVINPASRSGRGRKIWKEVEPIFLQKKLAYKAYLSQKPGDISRYVSDLTAAASSQHPIHLIILGGDGTLNEAIQGIRQPLHVILGYIPTGSSNDLARDLKLPGHPKKALEVILETGRIHQVDIGTVRYEDGSIRCFNVSCGIGFDAAVCENANTSSAKDVLNKLGLGKLIYLLIALKQLLAAKRIPCELYMDDKPPVHLHHFLFVATMIHRYEGGGFQFCPNADNQDGLLDICVIGSLPKILMLLALPTAFFGKHTVFSGIHAYRCRTIRIRTTAPLWVHTDGESIRQSQDITIDCRHQLINFIY